MYQSCRAKLGGLDFDGRAFGFDLGLEGGGVLGVQAFLDGLRSAVYQVFGFFEAKRGDLADDFDDVDLLVAGGNQDNVERSRGFGDGRGGSAVAGRGAAAQARRRKRRILPEAA